MRPEVQAILQSLLARHAEFETCSGDIRAAFETLAACFLSGGKLLICGNGGSAADADHIVGELMKGFLLPRPLSAQRVDDLRRAIPEEWERFARSLQGALPALSLTGQSAFSTAFANDVAPDMVFAQQVQGYGRPGDVLLALSTSGASRNILNAALTARAFGIGVIGLSGRGGGSLRRIADICITVPADETYRVQEMHQSIYHALCAMLEAEFFGETPVP